MKSSYPVPSMLLLLVSMSALMSASAQPQTLEFASGSGPTSFGSAISSQTITFQENNANPTGWSFSPYSTPTTTATFSVSNQQYSLPVRQNANGASVSFGATNNNSTQLIAPAKIFPQMSGISSPAANDFSSSNFPGQAGEGMSMTQNYGISVFTSVMGLYNAGASVRDSFYMANLTITFNTPVSNPVLHIVGIGGFAGSQGFSSELMLTTPGVSLSELSGSTGLLVTENQILNSNRTFTATTGSGAASGSVLVSGTVSSLSFQVYLKGDGGGSAWSTSSEHAGDEFLIGISTLVTNLVLPVDFSGFAAQPQGNTALLNWTTATEQNSNYFNIQSSSDGLSWSNIGEVKASGNSTTSENYSFTDQHPASGNNYYRVVEVNMDNSTSYSAVRQLTFGQSATVLTYYPNPARDRVTVTLSALTPQSVTVMSVDGKQLQQNDQFVSGGSIDLSSYAAGIYFLAIRGTGGQIEVLKILKD